MERCFGFVSSVMMTMMTMMMMGHDETIISIYLIRSVCMYMYMKRETIWSTRSINITG